MRELHNELVMVSAKCTHTHDSLQGGMNAWRACVSVFMGHLDKLYIYK